MDLYLRFAVRIHGIFSDNYFTEHLYEANSNGKRYVSHVGRDSSVGIATRYGLDGPGIESR